MALPPQVEKCQWEKKQKDRELEVFKREPAFYPVATACSTCSLGGGEDLHARAQQAALAKDEVPSPVSMSSQQGCRYTRDSGQRPRRCGTDTRAALALPHGSATSCGHAERHGWYDRIAA